MKFIHFSLFFLYNNHYNKYYNSAKDVPNFCKWGLGLITGGEHISRLVETLIEEVLPTAKLERRRYNKDNTKLYLLGGIP